MQFLDEPINDCECFTVSHFPFSHVLFSHSAVRVSTPSDAPCWKVGALTCSCRSLTPAQWRVLFYLRGIHLYVLASSLSLYDCYQSAAHLLKRTSLLHHASSADFAAEGVSNTIPLHEPDWRSQVQSIASWSIVLSRIQMSYPPNDVPVPILERSSSQGAPDTIVQLRKPLDHEIIAENASIDHAGASQYLPNTSPLYTIRTVIYLDRRKPKFSLALSHSKRLPSVAIASVLPSDTFEASCTSIQGIHRSKRLLRRDRGRNRFGHHEYVRKEHFG
jgi:hypothetical protein